MKFKTLKTIHEEIQLHTEASGEAKREYFEKLSAFDPLVDSEKVEYMEALQLFEAARERHYRLSSALDDFEEHDWN